MSLFARSSKTRHVEKAVVDAAAGRRLTLAHWVFEGEDFFSNRRVVMAITYSSPRTGVCTGFLRVRRA